MDYGPNDLNVLRQLLSYDPATGHFIWRDFKRTYAGQARPGAVAGYLGRDGYIMLRVNGRDTRAHRLAFLFMTGKPIPKGKEIDHINGIRRDNHWSNLRLVTRSQNCMNRHTIRSDNKSGQCGVSWLRGKWQAVITLNGKMLYLGVFAEKQDAIAARKVAELKYYGQYAAVSG